MPFKFKNKQLRDVIEITPQVLGDERGFFMETYKASDFAQAGIPDIKQMNHSKSAKNVLRGLHFQRDPKTQGKIVRVVSGEIFDVAVDMRRGSPTYGRWEGYEISSKTKNMIYIPKGFAHGFCVISDIAEVIYFCTDEYAPEYEGGIIWNDPMLNIAWPVEAPLLSDKDRGYPEWDEIISPFEYKPSGEM